MTKEIYSQRGERSGLVVPLRAREGLVIAHQMPRRRADLHQDLSAIQEETWGQWGGVNLIDREHPLGTPFSMYGSNKDFKVFSVDLDGLQRVNTGLLVANLFPNPNSNFDESYGSHSGYYNNRFLPQAGDLIHLANNRREFQTGIEDTSKITTVRSLEGIYNYTGEYKDLPQRLFDDGIRTVMPVHNPDNELGTGHPTKTKDGLSSTGKEFVAMCLALGIAIDLSHASTATSNDILNFIQEKINKGENPPRPLISHTAPYGLTERTTRSAADDVIVRVAEMDGIIGIVPIKRCVAKDEDNATIGDYVNAMEYVINLLQGQGIQDPVSHVAIGTDFNGLMSQSVIPGLDHIENFTPALDAEMTRRGFSEEDQDRVIFQNAVDYFAKNLPEA